MGARRPDPAATDLLIGQSGIYPAARDAQSSRLLQQPPAFFGQQKDFYATAKAIADTAGGFTWGPNVNVTYDVYKDAFGKAITGRTPFAGALDTMQTATVADMRKNGFTVTS
ncbi:hypothetical protein [Jidongwangia harbinensis]|uniref:hypothetical protein n=1 Tax=Jidongwangia harbinensis TaxID=2878561 RepID=UPI001CD984DC|nr:hypothetical protein [Jidongwangia harbinensis]MCA2211889.1 hypothetical protein [Jidongwangia harbinensis]